jgi:hypothetical protein
VGAALRIKIANPVDSFVGEPLAGLRASFLGDCGKAIIAFPLQATPTVAKGGEHIHTAEFLEPYQEISSTRNSAHKKRPARYFAGRFSLLPAKT